MIITTHENYVLVNWAGSANNVMFNALRSIGYVAHAENLPLDHQGVAKLHLVYSTTPLLLGTNLTLRREYDLLATKPFMWGMLRGGVVLAFARDWLNDPEVRKLLFSDTMEELHAFYSRNIAERSNAYAVNELRVLMNYLYDGNTGFMHTGFFQGSSNNHNALMKSLPRELKAYLNFENVDMKQFDRQVDALVHAFAYHRQVPVHLARKVLVR
jgi:hypothetical protein